MSDHGLSIHDLQKEVSSEKRASDELRQQVAELTARVFALEQRLAGESESSEIMTVGEMPADPDLSQFTLMGTVGNKRTQPDFKRAMKAGEAREAYESFKAMVAEMYCEEKVKDGRFGEMMELELVNDGPVTIIVDSFDRDGSAWKGTTVGPAEAENKESSEEP